MKALTLAQPWATLVAVEAKRIETRAWPTSRRGLVAIHAAKTIKRAGGSLRLSNLCSSQRFSQGLSEFGSLAKPLPLGAIIATAAIINCVSTNLRAEVPPQDSDEYAFGNYAPNRFMWFLDDVRILPNPIECVGAFRLWTVPEAIEAAIRNQLNLPLS
jgi:hypothetical protein